MNINFWLNGVNRHAEISPDTLLIDFLREQGCFSVKRGCETANCGLCSGNLCCQSRQSVLLEEH